MDDKLSSDCFRRSAWKPFTKEGISCHAMSQKWISESSRGHIGMGSHFKSQTVQL